MEAYARGSVESTALDGLKLMLPRNEHVVHERAYLEKRVNQVLF